MTLEDNIKTEAYDLGFALCGICAPEPPTHYPAYLKWLEEGCHADMAYMARPDAITKRNDPKALLTDCAAVLSLAFAYPSPKSYPKPQSSRPLGRISAYAIGPDYHITLQEKLATLTQRIKNLIPQAVRIKPCVDSAPILEKEYAQTAGLGWIGRNSCFTTQSYGSYVFLAELLLDYPLKPDPVCLENPCEKCIRCIMACPSKAIRPDRSIDARRCISYLTIEHRGSIPEYLRPYLGDHVFGCDLCQQVCPHNRNLSQTNTPLPSSIIDPYPDLITELSLSEEGFHQKYKGTAILRAKYQGYLRNVAIALGNNPHIDSIQPLEAVIATSNDPVIKEACQWALERCQSMA